MKVNLSRVVVKESRITDGRAIQLREARNCLLSNDLSFISLYHSLPVRRDKALKKSAKDRYKRNPCSIFFASIILAISLILLSEYQFISERSFKHVLEE